MSLRLLTASVLALLMSAAALADEPSAPADTLAVDLPDLVVRGDATAPPQPDRTRLEAPAVVRQDAGSMADLGGLLPSTRITINSRGDAHAMVRGASERHVQTFLDGIPLNLPWDERVDLETVPAVGVGTVEGRRGVVSLLDGPGVVAGSVRLLPPALTGAQDTELRLLVGDGGRGQVEARHQRRLGTWSVLGAGAWRTRDHWPLPGSGDPRFNSDLRQTSVLLRAARPVRETGRLSLLATAWTARKGVPPELHLGDEARFWRYPVRERLLCGGVLELPLNDGWDLGATLAADWHHQEIDARGPDGWGTPRLVGDDVETSWDRTGNSRLRLTRWLGDTAAVALQAAARYTHHREIAAVGDPTLPYAQWLTSLVLEGEAQPGRGWHLRAGAGWDHAAAPETGNLPGSPAVHAPAVSLRATRELAPGQAVHLALSRRSRVPALREAYSGALGRFLVNPDLGPERQDLVEVGGLASGRTWSLEADAFMTRLEGGIEREAVDATQFQRVNRSRIDVPGLEVRGRWTPRPDLDAQLQHTILDPRVEDAGEERPAEDRPAYLSRLEIAWSPPRGLGAAIEARVTGPRWSADGTAPAGLRRLPSGITWHARLSWQLLAASRPLELVARVDNLADARVDDQTGLPGRGREFSAGIRAIW
ncbi:MAG: TonB-dependent receptor [Candidatus Krumholzibacteriia bacterium]